VIETNKGSFRDPVNRVYEISESNKGTRIFRGVNADALSNFQNLRQTTFYNELVAARHLVSTNEVESNEYTKLIKQDGWSGVLEHETIPFISYPYEWSFSMLKDAAKLHLMILEKALEEGWTLKDATPFNIQFVNARPIFIDIPSLEPREDGAPWVGYRQFCSTFLTPLMLKAHLDIDHLPLLRSYLDGIPPSEAIKFFNGKARFKKGVLSHIALPAKVENSIQKKERDGVEAKERKPGKHSDAMVIGLVQSMRRLVSKLKTKDAHTDWSHYDQTHSYVDVELEKKLAFVEKNVSRQPRHHVWDIGCNTGTFSKIAAPYANMVLSLDGDHEAIEQLYQRETLGTTSNILPMVMNLANISPNHGWAGCERQALDHRVKPDVVLALALIHHTRISANIPNVMFLRWLRSLEAEIIIEFVTRDDEMVIKLLTNKSEQYIDYNLDQFVTECREMFKIEDRLKLKSGKREIFYLVPK